MTKQKILRVSRQLFHKQGIANVRLQQIADEAEISVGNLAYHFKNKEAIVETMYGVVFDEFYKLIEQPLIHNGLSDFDTTIKNIYYFNSSFAFCFNNLWEISRNYPEIAKEWKQISDKILHQINKRLHFYLNDKLLNEEPFKGAYRMLSHQILLNFICWIQHQQLKGINPTLASFKKSTWALIIPYFTKKAVRNYELMRRKN